MNEDQFQKDDTIKIIIGSNIKEIMHYIIIVILSIVLLQNIQIIDFNLFFWEIYISKIILLPIFIFIGYLFSRFKIFSTISRRKNKEELS